PRKPENEKKQQRKKRVVDPNKPKRSTGLSKPMKLSQDLASFLGQKYAARTELLNEHFIKPTPEENAEAIALLGLPPSHPAAADSAGLLPSSSVKAEGSSHSPAPSDGDTQHTGDEDDDEEEDEDDDDLDAKSETQPTSASTAVDPKSNLSQKLSPTIAATTSPLALPPMPSSINGAGGGATGI
ncbi:hypothetical protein GGI09_005611, partial [Coemansia sp. S100]